MKGLLATFKMPLINWRSLNYWQSYDCLGVLIILPSTAWTHEQYNQPIHEVLQATIHKHTFQNINLLDTPKVKKKIKINKYDCSAVTHIQTQHYAWAHSSLFYIL